MVRKVSPPGSHRMVASLRGRNRDRGRKVNQCNRGRGNLDSPWVKGNSPVRVSPWVRGNSPVDNRWVKASNRADNRWVKDNSQDRVSSLDKDSRATNLVRANKATSLDKVRAKDRDRVNSPVRGRDKVSRDKVSQADNQVVSRKEWGLAIRLVATDATRKGMAVKAAQAPRSLLKKPISPTSVARLISRSSNCAINSNEVRPPRN